MRHLVDTLQHLEAKLREGGGAERIVRQHPDARIIMVSSVGYQENIVAALQKGARHFVQKPVKTEVLYEVIKYVLGEDAVVATPAGGSAS